MSDDRTAIMSARALSPGYEILWYTIHEVLGQGGFGITYRAHDRNLDRFVAIKEYLPTPFAYRHQDYSVKPLTGDHHENYAWGLDSFLKETQTLAKFGHDNIVRVHSVFEENNTAYMVMEYEHGENLASIYKTRGRELDQLFFQRTFFPIFDGLEQIHAFGFIHRDIKPANVYIRENGTPVLIDFGSARQTSQQHTGEMTTLVSKGYTPLEQYSSNYGEQGPWTDIYALAASMYEGVVGAKPDESLSRSACALRNKPDLVQRLSNSQYPRFDQDFLDAVVDGLALEPEGRPQSLGAWQARFDATVRPSQQAASPPRGPADNDTRTAPAGHFTAAPEKQIPPPPESRAPAAQQYDEFAAMDFNLNDDFDSGDSADDDLQRPATGLIEKPRTEKPRAKTQGKKKETSSRKAGTKSGGGKKVLWGLSSAAVLILAAGAGYFMLQGGSAPTALTPAALAQLPRPALAVRPVPPKEQVLQELNELLTLSNFYKQASEIDPSNPELQAGVADAYQTLADYAGNWHSSRHTDVKSMIERVATSLPGTNQQTQAVLSALQPANKLTSVQKITALISSGNIASPPGGSVLDEVNKLTDTDYAQLKNTSDWQKMMQTLRQSAVEKLEQSEFNSAALIVEAALSLDPEDGQILSLQDHLLLK
ncbi:MAG: protein kinase [Gammaproteobacteria bacterium]|nr:protein kinase [Gammaproteobacteria bacterium]